MTSAGAAALWFGLPTFPFGGWVSAQPLGDLRVVDQGTACPWSLHRQEVDSAKALEKHELQGQWGWGSSWLPAAI